LPCWLADEFVHVTLLFNTVKGAERRAAAIADAPYVMAVGLSEVEGNCSEFVFSFIAQT
jgi:hypothetical protein